MPLHEEPVSLRRSGLVDLLSVVVFGEAVTNTTKTLMVDDEKQRAMEASMKLSARHRASDRESAQKFGRDSEQSPISKCDRAEA